MMFATIWRRLTDFLGAMEHADVDPVAEQRRRIVFLEERVARLETDHGKR